MLRSHIVKEEKRHAEEELVVEQHVDGVCEVYRIPKLDKSRLPQSQ